MNKEIAKNIIGFGLGILYPFFIYLLQIIICVTFLCNILLKIEVLGNISLILCIVNLIITTLDFILCLKHFIKRGAFLILDLWFFIKYSWLPFLLLFLHFVI